LYTAAMLRISWLFVLFLGLAACNRAPAPDTSTKSYTGKEAYELVCARCHAEGKNGAPKTGDPAAWEGRSTLWEAVLFEHAKKGYNNMPAKGGDEELDDATVERAAEYMLRQVYPDAPPD
jgi:cytochrome c5